MRKLGSLVSRIADTCRNYDLFAPGVTVIGVSGGIDSLVLLHILVALRKQLNLNLHVATLDHGLRGTEGATDAEFARQTAKAWSVPVTVGHADVPNLMKSEGRGVEDAARQVRYRFFAEVAQATGATQVALAHQRDDQIETILMHFVRGAGLVGLGGMRRSALLNGLRIVRPMLDITRAEIESYARQFDLQAHEDTTNTDDRFTRNRIRLKTIPLLREYNPWFDDGIARTAAIIQADEDALQWALKQSLPNWPPRADLNTFKQLPPGLRRKAVRVLDSQLSFERTESIVEWINEAVPGERCQLSDTQLLISNHGVLVLITDTFSTRPVNPRELPEFRFTNASFSKGFDPMELPFPILETSVPIPLSYPGINLLPNGWRLTIEPYNSAEEPKWDDPLSGVLAMPIDAVITLRMRVKGERFTPLGLGGHQQKLSDTLINLKVPSRWRDLLPLLTVNNSVAWFVAPVPNGLRVQVADPFAWRPDRELLWSVRYAKT